LFANYAAIVKNLRGVVLFDLGRGGILGYREVAY
jgi:hypothetical protein